MGRYVNDSPNFHANATIKALTLEGEIRLCLFAKKLIPAGTEVRYDYGKVDNLGWRKKKVILN